MVPTLNRGSTPQGPTWSAVPASVSQRTMVVCCATVRSVPPRKLSAHRDWTTSDEHHDDPCIRYPGDRHPDLTAGGNRVRGLGHHCCVVHHVSAKTQVGRRRQRDGDATFRTAVTTAPSLCSKSRLHDHRQQTRGFAIGSGTSDTRSSATTRATWPGPRRLRRLRPRDTPATHSLPVRGMTHRSASSHGHADCERPRTAGACRVVAAQAGE